MYMLFFKSKSISISFRCYFHYLNLREYIKIEKRVGKDKGFELCVVLILNDNDL